MNIIFSNTAWKQYVEWQQIDKSKVKRINELIKDIQRNGLLIGKGKPEALKYIKALAKIILEKNGRIYENVTCNTIKTEKDGYMCVTDSYNIVSKYVVVATHYPFLNVPGFYFSKIYKFFFYFFFFKKDL